MPPSSGSDGRAACRRPPGGAVHHPTAAIADRAAGPSESCSLLGGTRSSPAARGSPSWPKPPISMVARSPDESMSATADYVFGHYAPDPLDAIVGRDSEPLGLLVIRLQNPHSHKVWAMNSLEAHCQNLRAGVRGASACQNQAPTSTYRARNSSALGTKSAWNWNTAPCPESG